MKSKKKNSNYRRKNFQKGKRKFEEQKIEEFEYPDFILKFSIVNYDTLKKWHLIDSSNYKKHIQKQIKKNYEGGDSNE